MDMKADLEYDLFKTDWIVSKCKNSKYAQNLYAALCNNRFFKNDEEWTCSWRHSGGIVAELRNTFKDDLTKKNIMWIGIVLAWQILKDIFQKEKFHQKSLMTY